MFVFYPWLPHIVFTMCCMQVSLYLHASVCVRVCVCTCMCVCVYMYVCVCTSMVGGRSIIIVIRNSCVPGSVPLLDESALLGCYPALLSCHVTENSCSSESSCTVDNSGTHFDALIMSNHSLSTYFSFQISLCLVKELGMILQLVVMMKQLPWRCYKSP